mmetsp:Transcript_9426/g.13649  ORF Transcript_9426/g.13649 Transcript_9426/m.13649 type:complete len:197 (-) Transcript_9426:123-713(-)
MISLNSNYLSHFFDSPPHYCYGSRRQLSSKQIYRHQQQEYERQQQIKKMKLQQRDQQRRRQYPTTYETVLAYGPFGEIYRVQVPTNARSRPFEEPPTYEHEGHRMIPSRNNDAEEEREIQRQEASTTSVSSNMKEEHIEIPMKEPANLHKVENNSNFTVCVEDVTEEELSEDDNFKSNPKYSPGPGESWMEPMEQK